MPSSGRAAIQLMALTVLEITLALHTDEYHLSTWIVRECTAWLLSLPAPAY